MPRTYLRTSRDQAQGRQSSIQVVSAGGSGLLSFLTPVRVGTAYLVSCALLGLHARASAALAGAERTLAVERSRSRTHWKFPYYSLHGEGQLKEGTFCASLVEWPAKF